MIHRHRVRVSALLVVLGLGATASRGRCEDAPAPKAAPTMTEELMDRLIKYARARKETGSVVANVASVLGVWSRAEDMPLKLARATDESIGALYFGVPLDPSSRDVLVMVKRDGLRAYLTDRTAQLRAAAVSTDGVARLVTNESAADGFRSALSILAKEAAVELPPTTPDLPQWRGPNGGGPELSTRTVTTQQAWLRLWEQLGRPAPRALDEARDMAVFIAVGERPTGGYKPRIVSATAGDGKLLVVYTDGKPAPEDFVTQALTYPWVVAVVPKSSLPVVFQAQEAK